MTTSKIIRSAAAIVLAAMIMTSCASEYDDSVLTKVVVPLVRELLGWE